ncbi:Fungal specific transcription factor domain [Rhizoctonia solani]|uniref:Fungal specific transcription factor domain n=1 Tax=Rhizoctonia solani TaxID=456999 RepID=A0A8H7H9Z4_9AGAM|nr:Fungal specific transcription factor domain [Rhizoctonia solani]
MSAQNTTKRHARTRRGCLTCRIRKKKCDCTRPSCTKCERLHVQCLGYASDRPDWLKGENAKEYTQAIKCFLSEYPPAKAYDDPVPYLVLKPTAEVEQALARDPNRFNPVCFDPDNATLKRWLPAPPAPSSSPKAAFSNPSTEIMGASSSFTPRGYQPPSNNFSSPYPAPTPSPQTPYTLPAHSVYEAPADPIWSYTQPVADPYFYSGLFSTTQPGYGSLMSQGIATSDYYGQQDGHAVHYVSGPSRMLTRARRARQDMMRLGRQ